MTAYLALASILVISIILVALVIARRRLSGGPGRTIRFIGGPFPLSITLHAAALIFLIVTVHQRRAREFLLVNLEAGGGGGNGDELSNLDVPDVPMPDIAANPSSDLPDVDTSQAVAIAGEFSRAPNGIGIGVGTGMGSGHGPGIGSGAGGFSGFILDLRRKGLDVVLLIDGTDSMSLIMADVKARMRQLVQAIHRVVPTARVGIVVYGGEQEQIDSQPLTLQPAKLDEFLQRITAKGGGEWEENVGGGVRAAIVGMDWRPYARKVIVLVGDSPPKRDQYAAISTMLKKFRTENGTLSTVDVTAQEHERFERAFSLAVHGTEATEISPLPAFDQQTRATYLRFASEGGGQMKSLEGDEQVDREVLMLVFGDRWREEIANFARK